MEQGKTWKTHSGTRLEQGFGCRGGLVPGLVPWQFWQILEQGEEQGLEQGTVAKQMLSQSFRGPECSEKLNWTKKYGTRQEQGPYKARTRRKQSRNLKTHFCEQETPPQPCSEQAFRNKGMEQGMEQGKNKVWNKVGTNCSDQGKPCSEQRFCFSVQHSNGDILFICSFDCYYTQ